MDLAPGSYLAALDATAVDPDRPLELHGRVVLFLDDFTRSAANGLIHHASNRRWLRSLLEATLAALGCSIRDWSGDSHPEEVSAFMASLDLPASPVGWAATSIVNPLPPRAVRWLEERMDGVDMVVGFEIPVFLLRFLAQHGIMFLDVAIDPVRFARDLFLSVRTNCAALERLLQRNEVDEEIIRTDAALLRGYATRQGGGTIGDPQSRVAVFFGQTVVDRSLIRDGKLMRPADFALEFIKAAEGCDVLLLRPHPLEPDGAQLETLQRQIPAASKTSASSYALLASENVHHVASLSSSLITEAKYFSKAASAFVVPDTDNPRVISGLCSRRYRLDTSLLSTGFWEGRRPSQMGAPDLLRNSLGCAWGRVWPMRLASPPSAVARLGKRISAIRKALHGPQRTPRATG